MKREQHIPDADMDRKKERTGFMEPIEFKDIRYILAVENAGSFSRAAEKEYISQPALSRIVKKVEQELGLLIFDRGSFPLKLTPEGREVLALRAKDDAAAEKLAEKMEKYLERRRNENRNYAPKAYQALSDARVERKGLTLVMISGGEAGTETAALLAGE